MYGAPYGVAQPIYNPPVPSDHMIPGGTKLGQLMVIQGYIPPSKTQESHCINLKPHMGSGDICFHMSIRFHENCVVRNTRKCGHWQNEERHGGMPFSQGQQFQLMISVHQDAFKISVNGSHFVDFKHRVPYQQINAIAFDGEFTIQSVSFQNDPVSGFPTMLASGSSPYPANAPIYNPPVPSDHMIPGGVTLGQVIAVQGYIPPNKPQASHCINLKPYMGSDDVSFHMSIRFHENCVVRNTKQGGYWQAEERHGGMPFTQGQQFQVIISVHQDAFKIAVNGSHFADFKHRMPYQQINAIAFSGEFTIQSVSFQNDPASVFPTALAPGFTPYPANAPIYNPPVPSDHIIPGGAKLGQVIIIQGYIPPTKSQASRCINLKPKMGSDDVSFHMSIRFHENCVVRNTKQGGYWQAEERHGGMPFTQGQHFQVMISVHQDAFKVAVNGSHFADFRHRVPYQQINAIAFDGEFTIQSLSFQNDPAVSRVSNYPTGPATPPPPYTPYPPIYNPHVPYSGPIPGGLYPGRMISVQGIPRAPTRFAINLVLGKDIAFHFNPRFDDGNCVVRNTRAGDSWGPEERHGSMPFVLGAMFDIKILCESNCYKVAVNNQHFCEYYHRLNQLNMIQGLEVGGDVQLTQISIQ